MRLDQLRWPEVSARAPASLLAVPVGSTEQHGPHLPLSTDSDIAVALCERLATGRGDVLVSPPLAYGSSGEHCGFPGTLSIGAHAVQRVLVELGRSADAFGGVVFVSTHGGNAGPVAAAVRLLTSESRPVKAWSPAPVAGAAPGDAHAGFVETSVMLALRPTLVDLRAAAAGRTEPLRELMPALRAAGVRAVSPNGVLGDPSGASAARGEEVLAGWTASLAAALEGWP